MKLYERLYELRRKAGITQSDAAEALDVSRQTISKWETGIAAPGRDKLLTISKLYGVSLDDLLENPAPPVTEQEKKKKKGNTMTLLKASAAAIVIMAAILIGVAVAYHNELANEGEVVEVEDTYSRNVSDFPRVESFNVVDEKEGKVVEK